MKAARRHELRENDLAHALEAARDYFDRHGKKIGLGAIIILAVFTAVSFGIRSRAASAVDTWRRKALLAFDTYDKGKESLASLAALEKESDESAFVLQCLMDLGRNALRVAQLAPVPPDAELNETARGAFEELRRRYPDNPLALGAALLGLASVEENAFLLDGNASHKEQADKLLSEVISYSLLTNVPPMQRMAVDRKKALDATFTKIVVVPPVIVPPPEADASPSVPLPTEPAPAETP